MADVFTTTATLAQATLAYEQLAYYDLRPELYFDSVATVRPTRQTHPGSSVRFKFVTEMAPAITPLSESVDVDAVALADTQVDITLNEYGNAVISSARIRAQSFLTVSEEIANAVGFNAGLSFDCLARNPLLAGTNVIYGGAAVSRVTVSAVMNLTAAKVAQVAAQMSDANVQRLGNYWRGFMASVVAYDLRRETGSAGWRDPHVYGQQEQIWNGETGIFEGVAWVETPRLAATNLTAAQGGPGGFVDGGVGGTVDVYPVLILGNQALAKTWAKAVSNELPAVILGNVTDKLMRFVPVGWYWMGGFGRFREAAIRRIEVASTLGAN